MPDATWYEITCFVVPMIRRRLVSSETACHVFHTNGRKSRKADDRGNVDWHKTFDGAKQELVLRAARDIDAAKTKLIHSERRLCDIQALTEEQCSKNN